MIALLYTISVCCFCIGANVMIAKISGGSAKNQSRFEYKIKDFDILYDESKGHVLTAKIDGIIHYFMHNVTFPSEADEYYDKHIANVYQAPLRHWLSYHSREYKSYDPDVYAKLSKEPRVEYVFPKFDSVNDPKFYTRLVVHANRYTGDQLGYLEELIDEIKVNRWSNLPEQELLKLNILNETEEHRQMYFDLLSTKY